MDHRKFPFKLFILSTIISISSTSDDYCVTGFDSFDGMYVSADEPVYSQQYNDMYSSDYVEIDEPVYYGLSSHRYMYRYYCDAYTCQGYSWRFGQNTRGVTPDLICDSASAYPPSSCEWYTPGSSNTQSVRINPGECVSTTEKPIEVSNCTIVYDNMNDPISTGWIFNDTYGSVISTADHSGSCADFPCTVLEGNYPMMTKVFTNISSYSHLTSIQMIYHVACYVGGSTRGYFVQFKWGSDGNWMQWDMDPEVTHMNYLHNLQDPPAVNVPLYIRFKYKWMGAPALYIDNFYLKATTSSCPEEKQISPKSTKISLTSETVIIAGAVLLIVICCCVICFCSTRRKSKRKQSKDVPTETGRTQNHQPQINTADNEKVEGYDNQVDLELVNTADNEEVEGDDIKTVVTHQ